MTTVVQVVVGEVLDPVSFRMTVKRTEREQLSGGPGHLRRPDMDQYRDLEQKMSQLLDRALDDGWSTAEDPEAQQQSVPDGLRIRRRDCRDEPEVGRRMAVRISKGQRLWRRAEVVTRSRIDRDTWLVDALLLDLGKTVKNVTWGSRFQELPAWFSSQEPLYFDFRLQGLVPSRMSYPEDHHTGRFINQDGFKPVPSNRWTKASLELVRQLVDCRKICKIKVLKPRSECGRSGLVGELYTEFPKDPSVITLVDQVILERSAVRIEGQKMVDWRRYLLMSQLALPEVLAVDREAPSLRHRFSLLTETAKVPSASRHEDDDDDYFDFYDYDDNQDEYF